MLELSRLRVGAFPAAFFVDCSDFWLSGVEPRRLNVTLSEGFVAEVVTGGLGTTLTVAVAGGFEAVMGGGGGLAFVLRYASILASVHFRIFNIPTFAAGLCIVPYCFHVFKRSSL